jgi:hypothetical protein
VIKAQRKEFFSARGRKGVFIICYNRGGVKGREDLFNKYIIYKKA